MSEPLVTAVCFRAARGAALADGLLGYVSFEFGPFLLEGVMLRVTASPERRLTLAFPKRRHAHGLLQDIVRPIDQAARDQIESAIFAALGIERSSEGRS